MCVTSNESQFKSVQKYTYIKYKIHTYMDCIYLYFIYILIFQFKLLLLFFFFLNCTTKHKNIYLFTIQIFILLLFSLLLSNRFENNRIKA